MSSLTLWVRGAGSFRVDSIANVRSKVFRFIFAATALIIVPERIGGGLFVTSKFGREIVEQEFAQPRQGNRVRATGFGKEPIGQPHERFKRRSARPDQRRGRDKIAAVADQVPIAREAAETLHGPEIDQ